VRADTPQGALLPRSARGRDAGISGKTIRAKRCGPGQTRRL